MPEKEKVPRRRGRVEDLGAGRFKVTVYVGTQGGKRCYHRKTLRNSTEPKARKYAREVAAGADRGEHFTPTRLTLKEWLDDCLDRMRRDGLRQTTLANVKRLYFFHITAALGETTPLRSVTTDAQQKFCNRLQDEGYKSSTIRVIHRALKRALARAVTKGLLKENAAALVELPPRNPPKKAKVFDEEEAVRFIESCWRERGYLMFIFALLSGMRPSEFFGLEYADLSLERDGETVERGVARVTKGVVWCDRKWYLNPPKTPAGRRPVYFPAMIYHELAAQRGAHLEWLKGMGQKHQFIFTDNLGRPLKASNMTLRFYAACKAAGLSTEGRSLYTLRRSHATISLLAGENLKSLSERMGHSSVEFTQDEYVDALPAMMQTAADVLESRLLRNHLAASDGSRMM